MIAFFFFNDTATTEIYTLSLHDALPISRKDSTWCRPPTRVCPCHRDRKSTRLNSSHTVISYAVFCLKKKNAQSPLQHVLLILPHLRQKVMDIAYTPCRDTDNELVLLIEP